MGYTERVKGRLCLLAHLSSRDLSVRPSVCGSGTASFLYFLEEEGDANCPLNITHFIQEDAK